MKKKRISLRISYDLKIHYAIAKCSETLQYIETQYYSQNRKNIFGQLSGQKCPTLARITKIIASYKMYRSSKMRPEVYLCNTAGLSASSRGRREDWPSVYCVEYYTASARRLIMNGDVVARTRVRRLSRFTVEIARKVSA